MNASFQTIDYLIFIVYGITILGVGLWVSRDKKGHEKNAEDYFLAGRALPWWIIGASLIASNISTEQIIGMNGTAFESGIAVISYSLIGASLTILLVARFFLPRFLRPRDSGLPFPMKSRKRPFRNICILWAVSTPLSMRLSGWCLFL